MIKNIIFDIGNVLMTFDPVSYYCTIFQNDDKTADICNKIFGHEAWLKYDQGVYMIEDLYRIYLEEYPVHEKEIKVILKDWMKLMQPMQENQRMLLALKQLGYRVYLLSNISKDSADYLKQTQPFFDWCDGAVLSYEEKLLKPDIRVYECLLKRYDLDPTESVFLDDNKKNIESAKALGIKGIVVSSCEQCRNEIEKLLECSVVC